MLKRIFDILVALLGTAILFPFFIVISLCIKLESKGPIFFLQERVGKGGKLFKLIKFRTMHVGADKFMAITVGKRDPRITRVGHFLRRFKIDEFPQLINVLLGEMSLVGPRPELKKFVDLYDERQRQVITIRPGITDYASIQFRNENELLEGQPDPVGYYSREILPVKLNLNLEYISSQSIVLDVKILLKTAISIFYRSKGGNGVLAGGRKQ
jgi:lipopolysaccharide/colanic/teichoic acid biosynthesis glycosyltransferase